MGCGPSEASNKYFCNACNVADCCELDIYHHDNEYGYCMISLDKVSYNPKETITGNIYWRLDTDFPNKELFLMFYGYEEVLYFNPNKSKNIPCIEKNLHYNNLYSIKKFDTQFKNGDYVFPFKITLKDNLHTSYLFNYIDDGEKAFSKNRFFMMAGILDEKNKIKNSLVSPKLEVFIEVKNDQLIKNNINTINSAEQKGLCTHKTIFKGEISNKKNDNFIYGNTEYEFDFKLDRNNSNIELCEILLNLVSEMEVRTKHDEKDRHVKTLYEKNLGHLKKGENRKFEFKINKNIIDPYICTINSNNISHNFYFKINLRNRELKYNALMQFPIIVKSGKIKNAFFHEKYKYYSGNCIIFEKNFHPIIDKNTEELKVLDYIKKDNSLIKYLEKEDEEK